MAPVIARKLHLKRWGKKIYYVINENGRDKNESKTLCTVENKKTDEKERREQERLRRWMDGEGWGRREGGEGGRERRALSGEERESRNERYIASGKQKTIVTLPPITHFNLKQQIFFTQLISTHWSRGLGWSWAFMCSCCCKAYTHLCLSLSPLSFCLQLSSFFFPPENEHSALEWTGTLWEMKPE